MVPTLGSSWWRMAKLFATWNSAASSFENNIHSPGLPELRLLTGIAPAET